MNCSEIKKCGNCDKTDGLCYTSNPPKVKCTVSGKFHYYDDDCDIKTITIDKEVSKGRIGVACIVCGETVLLNEHEVLALKHRHNVDVKVCDECKKAILYIRDKLSTAGRAIMD